MPFLRFRRPAVVLAVVALALGACNPTASPSPTATLTPAASPTGSPAASPGAPSSSAAASGDPAAQALYQAIEDAVIGIRELQPKEEVDPQLLTEDEVKERTASAFREDNPEELIEANEVLYRALGMLEEDASLTDLYVELLGSQVAGFYEPDTKELYVVTRSGGLGVSERVTYAHEFTHALQDQYFNLGEMGLDEVGQGDRNAARLALIEGDATTAMLFWAQRELTPEEAVKLLEESQDPEAQAILARMPAILRESLTFPYEQGLQLVLRIHGAGGWTAVNEAFSDPPASTEQVMHPEKYDAREKPLEVDLPADLATRMGTGWSVPYEDTFGEFQFQVWLRNALDATTGNRAAAGWGGDRFAVLRGPDDDWAVVMKTEWDSADEAAEFEQAASDAVRELGDGSVLIDDTEVTVVVASDAATLTQALSAAGFVTSG